MINDKGGDVVWESGDNRKVDLASFAGRDGVVVVEDDGFNKKHRAAKVYPESSSSSTGGGGFGIVEEKQGPPAAHSPAPDMFKAEVPQHLAAP